MSVLGDKCIQNRATGFPLSLVLCCCLAIEVLILGIVNLSSSDRYYVKWPAMNTFMDLQYKYTKPFLMLEDVS